MRELKREVKEEVNRAQPCFSINVKSLIDILELQELSFSLTLDTCTLFACHAVLNSHAKNSTYKTCLLHRELHG